MLVHDDVDGNLGHQSFVAPFVREAFHERAVFQLGQQLWCDASTDVDAVDRHGLQRQIPGFCSIDGGEQIQRLFRDFRLALESRLRDFRGRIAGLNFFRQPGRFIFLRITEIFVNGITGLARRAPVRS